MCFNVSIQRQPGSVPVVTFRLRKFARAGAELILNMHRNECQRCRPICVSLPGGPFQSSYTGHSQCTAGWVTLLYTYKKFFPPETPFPLCGGAKGFLRMSPPARRTLFALIVFFAV